MGNKIKRDKFEASRFNFWFVWKKGWKTFSRHKKLNFPIIFIVGFAIALGASILELSQFRMELQKEVIDRQNFTDVFINTELLPINTMNDYIESQKNLYSDYELRLNLPVSFNFGSDNERILGFIVGINSSRKIHINHLLDPNGNQLLSENATLNTEYHLDNPSIGIGEKITIFIGNENISLNIQNIGYSYEWLYASASSDTIVNSLDSIPIVYLDLELCKQFFQGQIMVNQILARSQDSITPNNLKIGIISSLNENIKSAYTVEEYPPIKLSTEDSQQDSKMINYISIILIITAAITLLIVLTRRIDEDIKQIGVFNALGASKKEIFNSYLIYILIIDSLGILASLILSIGFGSIWSYLIQNMLKMPNLGLNLSLSFSVFNYIAILFPLSLISGFIIIRRTLSLDPMSIIKRESKYLQHTNFVEKIFHWKKKQISPFGKYNLRKMLNQKGYSILTIVALSISVCLLTSSLILMNIIPNSLDNKFEQTEKWDAFGKCWNYENQSQFEENISIIQGIEQISFGIIDTVQLLNDEKKNNDSYENELISNDEELGYYQLSAFQKLNSLHEFPIKEGRKYDDENEILVSIDLKYQLNYNIGDNISIHSLKTSIDYNLTFKIVGFVNDFNQKTLYVPLDIAQIITNQSDKINVFYYTVNLNSEEKIHENIGALNVVQFTMTKEEMKSMWDSLLNMMDMVIPILGIFIIFLAILIILTITKSVISYRTHDYGNLKSIGIYYRDIRNAIWIEMMIFMIISVLLSIPLSDLLMNNLMIEMHSEMPGIIYNFDPLILIYITISSIIMIFGGTLEPLITLKRLPLAKILREKNFG